MRREKVTLSETKMIPIPKQKGCSMRTEKDTHPFDGRIGSLLSSAKPHSAAAVVESQPAENAHQRRKRIECPAPASRQMRSNL